MKSQKVSKEQFDEIMKNRPVRKVGQWKDMISEVLRSKTPIKISDVTRGQLWSIKRQAREAGANAVILSKENAIIISPKS